MSDCKPQDPRNERLRALELTLTQIEKQFGKGSVMRLSQQTHLDVPAIATGSIAVDLAIGIGGVPRGRVVEIFGPESSGKTTLALSIIASAQRSGGIAAFTAKPSRISAVGPVSAKAPNARPAPAAVWRRIPARRQAPPKAWTSR